MLYDTRPLLADECPPASAAATAGSGANCKAKVFRGFFNGKISHGW
jgi:hypothetical protein